MRAFLWLGLAVLLTGCRDKVMPGSAAPEASAEQLATLHAGNQRLAAKILQHVAETKKVPETLEALKAWATAAKSWEPDDEKSLTDPWGNPLVIGVIPIGFTFTLRSSGPDKKEKTTDDLYYDSRDKGTKTFKERNG